MNAHLSHPSHPSHSPSVLSVPSVVNNPPDTSKRIARIQTYHQGTIRAFEDQMGYAFMAGVEFLALKDSVPHGEFEKLCTAQLADVPKRTRIRYMGFASALMDKSATVALLAKEPRLLTSGEIADDDRKKICKTVKDLADGKTLTELYRDLGVIRDAKKQEAPNKCPHCHKAVSATASTCPHCKKDIAPKLTAEEIAAAKREQSRDHFQRLCGMISLAINPESGLEFTDIQRQLLIAAHTQASQYHRGKLSAKQAKAVRDLLDNPASADLQPKEIKQRLKALRK
jgi:hypothetical protein